MKKYIIYISMLVAASSSVMADYEDYRRENLQKRDFSGKSMQYAKLTYADASYANFIETNLYAADLGTVNLTGASFENANLTNANLNFATLKDASFSDATIKWANFGRTDITIFQLRSTRSYKNKDLEGVGLYFTDLAINNSKYHFSGFNLKNASFLGARLINVDFNNADLTGADLSSAKLGADANFNSAIITGAKFSDSVNSGLKFSMIAATQNYEKKDLSGIDFSRNKFSSAWNFSGLKLNGTNFSGAVLSACSFRDADIRNANFEKSDVNSVLSETRSYKDKTLTGINFKQVDLSSVYLKGMNLTSSTFTLATLPRVLEDVNLTSADFSSATFTVGATFKNANLTNTNFRSATLRNATFDNAVFCKTDFTLADLSGCSFKNANLQHSYFSVVKGADFTNADLRGGEDPSLTGNTLKNTVFADGVIKNFKMDGWGSLTIRKYEPLSENGEMISAKISDNDATISGKAKLELEQGAFFEVVNGKTLTVASDGLIQIHTDLSGSTIFNVNSNSGLVFEDGSTLTVNIIDDIITSDAYTFAVISFEDDSRIAGLNNFVKDETLFLTVNGEKFNGAWDYAVKGNDLSISINVPEPATYAAIFGALALAFAAYRRRK